MNYKFSVIIPSYNNLDLFKNALFSVINQQRVNLEIVVVDDSNSCIIKDFVKSVNDNRIKYTHNNPSLGAVNNWNYGISKTTGNIIVILHHDESFCDINNYLHNCEKLIQKGNDIIVSKIIINHINGATNSFKFPTLIKHFIYNFCPSLLFFVNMIGPVSCIVIKKNQIKEFDTNLNWYVDVDWYYRIFDKCRIYVADSFYILSNHGHENQISNTIDIEIEKKLDLRIIKKKYGRVNYIFLMCLFSNLIRKTKINSFFKSLLLK